MADTFTQAEVDQIVQQARSHGLTGLTCPRDGVPLGYKMGTYALLKKGQVGLGIKHGDFHDVQSIVGVNCPKCGGNAGHVQLT